MTSGTIHIACDELYERDAANLAVTEVERVQVSFPAEDGAGEVCRHCGETIEEYDDPDSPSDWFHAHNGDQLCDSDLRRMMDDGEEFPPRGATTAEPDTSPGSWCNSAAIIVDDDENSVTVTISVGDPRGAFAFTVRKVMGDENHCRLCNEPKGEVERGHATTFSDDPYKHDFEPGGYLILHTPYPGEGMPHVALTELRAGTFLIA